ncbi:MAG: hypothetical protein CK531_09605 [Gemmatimonadetes bacterium]|nr:MAG: hypothetical protein CK531_09605 [Gemmatimonadota bacterium]
MRRHTHRLVAFASLCLMLTATLGGPALACATAMRAPATAPTTSVALTAHEHHQTLAETVPQRGDEASTAPAPDHVPCEPSALDCCEAVVPCTVTLEAADAFSMPTRPAYAPPVAAQAATEPASLVISPDPPPPKA